MGGKGEEEGVVCGSWGLEPGSAWEEAELRSLQPCSDARCAPERGPGGQVPAAELERQRAQGVFELCYVRLSHAARGCAVC